jgi:NAD(P)-dependent dehydrogenase (short-subunit alcohol dehydrogenase family)
MSEQRLRDKVIVITGSTQGVGEGIARRCAEEGAAGLVVCGRDQVRGETVARDLADLGCEAVLAAGDLADVAICRQTIALCAERFGRIDGLVNAAGLNVPGHLHDTSVELWDRMFAVNARAPFVLTQEAVRLMKAKGSQGSIVNILSIAIHGGMASLTPYAASKGALATLTRNVACAHSFDRIRCNGIVLGWTDTPGEAEFQRLEGNPDDWRERGAKELPFGRLITPRDVAALCVFLLSEESGIMTGALIECDQMVLGTFDI